jgi:hypothetical protein
LRLEEYLAGVGHPSPLRGVLVTDDQFNAERKNQLLRAQLLLVGGSDSDLLPIEDKWRITVCLCAFFFVNIVTHTFSSGFTQIRPPSAPMLLLLGSSAAHSAFIPAHIALTFILTVLWRRFFCSRWMMIPKAPLSLMY